MRHEKSGDTMNKMNDNVHTQNLIFILLIGLAILVIPVGAFCNDISTNTLINDDSFANALALTDQGRLSLVGIGYPGTSGNLDMSVEILDQIRNDENYAEQIERGFILELSNDNTKKYYEIYPGGTGYREVTPDQDNQNNLVIPDLIGDNPGFSTNIFQGIEPFSHTDSIVNTRFPTGSLSVADTYTLFEENDKKNIIHFSSLERVHSAPVTMVNLQGADHSGYTYRNEVSDADISKIAMLTKNMQGKADQTISAYFSGTEINI